MGINVNNIVKDKKKFIFIFFNFSFFIGFFLIMLYRVRFGVEFSDESWYVAEPYIAAKGAVPYYDLWTQASGFVFPLSFVFKLFLFCTNGETEGIVLFSRILYLIWVFCIVYILHRIVKDIPLVFGMPIALYASGPLSLFAINYNTIGLVYLPIALSLLFMAQKEEKEFLRALWAGMIIARAVIGTPSVIVPCIMILGMLIICRRAKAIQGYIFGGIIIFIVVVLYCAIAGDGVINVFAGLRHYILDGSYFKIRKLYTKSDTWDIIIKSIKPLIVCTFLCLISRVILVKRFYIYRSVILVVLALSYMIGIYAGGKLSIEYFFYFTWFIGGLIYIFLKEHVSKNYLIIAVVLYCQFLFMGFTNTSGLAYRYYILLFSTVASLYALYEKSLNYNIVYKIVVYLFLAATTVLFVKENYCHIYRDEPIKRLTVKVDSGIWKGCYTTVERARDIVILEEAIRDMTKADEKILFMDWVSFAYLMSNGNAFSSTTLDPMNYSYGINHPQIMYDYFELKGDIPDKIIYVDYGRDEKMSIERRDWQFNNFVLQNYNRTVTKEWNGYRIWLFERASAEN